MKIIDCFTFYNEFDVLELRLKELYETVDQFVLVESDRTHSNQVKEFGFNLDDPRWAEYKDKILAIHYHQEPEENRWTLENAQRNAIWYGVQTLELDPYDFVMVSDVDEIPDLASWNKEEGVFIQKHSYYHFDWVDPRPWNGTVGMFFARFTSIFGKMCPQDLRNFRDLLKPCGYGWHFGWLGSVENAQNKVRNFAHGELDNPQFVAEELPEKVKFHQHPDGTQLIYTNVYLPKACADYPQYFAGPVGLRV